MSKAYAGACFGIEYTDNPLGSARVTVDPDPATSAYPELFKDAPPRQWAYFSAEEFVKALRGENATGVFLNAQNNTEAASISWRFDDDEVFVNIRFGKNSEVAKYSTGDFAKALRGNTIYGDLLHAIANIPLIESLMEELI